MTDFIPLPPPTIPNPPAQNTPRWKKKRYIIPTAVVGSLIAISAVAPAADEESGTGSAVAAAVEVESTSEAVMPDVVGMNLQDAQDKIQEAGVFYSRSEDATGEGRRQIMDRNWVVVGQNIEPGASFGEGDAVLSVVKEGEEVSAAAPEATAAPTTTEVKAPTTTVAPKPASSTPARVPAPTTTLAPSTTVGPRPAALGNAVTITKVVDGDTVDISTGERVRILGYDTPERGECGTPMRRMRCRSSSWAATSR